MVRAILGDRKNQTRRIIKNQPTINNHGRNCDSFWLSKPFDGLILPEVNDLVMYCPQGRPGDRIWVKENWRTYKSLDHLKPRDIEHGIGVQYEAGGSNVPGQKELYGMGKLRPSMFMPRWASRILLEITNIRVERLNDISEEDAVAEGCISTAIINDAGDDYTGLYANEAYRILWQSINSQGSWDLHPWLWVIEFKVLSK